MRAPPTRSNRPPAIVLGVPIDDLTMDEAVETVGELVQDGRRTGRTHQVATVNVDFIVNAVADAAVLRLLQNADVCLADGAPVVWGARAAGTPIRERIAGADLVPALAERSVTEGWRIHLFGSAPGTAERAAQLLRDRFPGACITGDSGPMLADVTTADDALLESLVAADADILCVALGNPKQERFIDAHRDRLKTPVLIGVGGTLDFIVGGRRRAPRWAQRVGLEWVFRAAQEPMRLGKRYAHDAVVFFPRLARSLRELRVDAKTADVLRYEICGDEILVTTGASNRGAVTWSEVVDAIQSGCRSIALDLGQAGRLSTSAVCELAGLVRVARRTNIHWNVLRPPSSSVSRQLHAIGLETYLLDAETTGVHDER